MADQDITNQHLMADRSKTGTPNFYWWHFFSFNFLDLMQILLIHFLSSSPSLIHVGKPAEKCLIAEESNRK